MYLTCIFYSFIFIFIDIKGPTYIGVCDISKWLTAIRKSTGKLEMANIYECAVKKKKLNLHMLLSNQMILPNPGSVQANRWILGLK